MRAFALALLFALFAACGSDDDAPGRVAPGTNQRSSTTTSTSEAALSSSTEATANRDERVDAARADLVARFGYDPSEISVVTIEQVTWPNGGLGCPEHDRQYDPAPVPGYRIVLRWKDIQFRYHGAAGDVVPALCQFLD